MKSKWLGKLSLKFKLVLSCVCASTLVLITMGAIEYNKQRQQLAATLESTITGVSKRLSDSLIAPIWNFNKDDGFNLLKTEMSTPEIAAIVVRDDKEVIFTGILRDGDKFKELAKVEDLPHSLPTKTCEVNREGKIIGKGIIYYTQDELVRRLGELTKLTVTRIVLVAGILIAVLLLVLSQFVFRPLKVLTNQALTVHEAVIHGELKVRADRNAVGREFRPILDGMNELMEAFAAPVDMTARYLNHISKGDIPSEITEEYHGDFNTIKDALNRCIKAINLLIFDANMLSKSAVEGRLDARADASMHQGDFQKIIQGVNDTLDAVISPLNMAARCVDDISKGKIPSKITEQYNGDFAALKNNLNQCIEAVNLLIADANMLSKSAVQGDLRARANASRHQGDFRKIIQGVNDTLDAVISPLNMAAQCVDDISKGKIPPKITEQYNGDFAALKNNLNQCIEAVNLLIADANMLSQAAVQGDLRARADASRHQGDFRKIIQGVNATLDAVIAPLNMAAAYLDRVAHGDIPATISDHWEGDFAALRNNLNTCVNAIHALVDDASGLANAASQGMLDRRAESTRHLGQFRSIVEGMNNTLAGVVAPLRDVGDFLQQLSECDFTGSIQADYPGEYHRVREAANTAVQLVRAAVSGVSNNTRSLADDVELLNGSSRSISSAAEETHSRANMVSSSVKQVSNNVQSIAAATQELSASIREIARSATEATSVVSQAVGAAENTSSTIQRLDHSSTEIGQVSKVIGSIAQQTNLLALNATIEAARAGEAGKGFAVVANEVKNLSKETARATEDISRRVEAIQHDTRAAVEAIVQISSIIKNINDLQTTIASAVEEQSAVTNSIEQSITEAATGVDDIAQHISGVAQATATTAQGVESIRKSADMLSRTSGTLCTVVTKFRC